MASDQPLLLELPGNQTTAEPPLLGDDNLPGYTQVMLSLRQLAVPILTCGIAANALSYLVFSQTRIWRHYLSAYLRALSLNDMLLLVSYAVASRTDVHIRSRAGCFASVFAYSLFSMLSPWLLVCVALDRALCVGGHRRGRGFVFRRAPAVIACLSAAVLLVNCHVFYTTVYSADPAFNGSAIMNCKPRAGTEFVFILDGFATALVPGVVLSFLNGFICCQVRRVYRSQSGSSVRLHSQVTRMLLGFSLAYLLLNMPNSVAFLASLCLTPAAAAADGRAFEAMNLARQLGQTLYFVHFSINSAVCACANRRYRVAFLHLGQRLLLLLRRGRRRHRPLMPALVPLPLAREGPQPPHAAPKTC